MNLGCSRVLPRPQGLKASWHLLTSMHMQRPELNEIRTNLRSNNLSKLNSETRPTSSVHWGLQPQEPGVDRSDPGRSSESESADADSIYIRTRYLRRFRLRGRVGIGVHAAIFVRFLPDYPERVLCSNSKKSYRVVKLKDRGMVCTWPCDSHWKAASSSSTHTTWSWECICK